MNSQKSTQAGALATALYRRSFARSNAQLHFSQAPLWREHSGLRLAPLAVPQLRAPTLAVLTPAIPSVTSSFPLSKLLTTFLYRPTLYACVCALSLTHSVLLGQKCCVPLWSSPENLHVPCRVRPNNLRQRWIDCIRLWWARLRNSRRLWTGRERLYRARLKHSRHRWI